MKILVAGGNGYVGRELCRLLRQEHEVCVVDNLRYGVNRHRPEELAHITLRRVDIRCKAEIQTVVNELNPDVMIHLAAIHFIPECENDPELAVSTNVLGTVNLISACHPSCRFIFASSGAVYAPDDSPHHEASSLVKPADIYGMTKLQGEEYVRYFAATRGLAAVIVRLFNVVGPGETNPHVLPEIIAQLKAGRRSLQLGNLDSRRDCIHVQDAAGGFAAAALQGTLEPGEVITVNLGTQQTYSVRELLAKLRSIAGIEFSVETDASRFRKVDRPFLAADITAIKNIFGWQPRRTVEVALADLWANPDLPDYLMQKYQG